VPRWQCGFLAARRRGGRRGDATGSSQRLGRSTLAWASLEFHRLAARRGAEGGDGFGTVMGAVSGQVCNGFHPRRREADMRGP
jgi:hypothetical protein